jgi:23S rRNA pseudouridine1911/1915/1917 synthase
MLKTYKVNCGKTKILISDYLTEAAGVSARQAKKLLKHKKVLLNGKQAYRDNKLKDGDILELDMSEERREDIIAEAIELSVIYEDEHLLAVNKPPYMLVHPTPNHPSGTLLNAAAYYFARKDGNIPLRLLNRLDMNTSGVVVLPKNSAVHKAMDEQMNKGSIRKFYIAITEGVLTPEKGVIAEPIGKDEDNPIRRKVTPEGQPAATAYETISRAGDYSAVRLELMTGRTHQIRVHLSHMGCPIVGDSLYGKESPLIGRQALHAVSMTLPLELPGMEIKTIELHAELPQDMKELAEKLGLEII